MHDWGEQMFKDECNCCYIRNFHNKEFKGLTKNCKSCATILYEARCISLEFGELYYFDDDIVSEDEDCSYCANRCLSVHGEQVINSTCKGCLMHKNELDIMSSKNICAQDVNNTSTGLKFDDNKPMFSCLPPHGLTELGKIAALGASKYGKDNYRGGIKVSRLLDAAYRHLIYASDGKDHDEVDGNNHLASVAWNVLAALQVIKDYPELDDRYGKLK